MLHGAKVHQEEKEQGVHLRHIRLLFHPDSRRVMTLTRKPRMNEPTKTSAFTALKLNIGLALLCVHGQVVQAAG